MPTAHAGWLKVLMAAGATDSTPTHRRGDDLPPEPPMTRRKAKARQTRRNAKCGQSTPVQSESEFQAQVVQLAKLHGWEVVHFPDSRRVSCPGWVDLVCGHEARGEVIYVELKREGQKPRPSQVWWHERLRAVGCRVYVWTAREWDEAVKVLTGGR